MPNLRHYWKKLRSHYWLALGFDLLALVILMLAIQAWQTRYLPLGEASPPTFLPLLASETNAKAVELGSAGVVYFFAPWCTICERSIGNLDQQVLDGSIAWAKGIALDYANETEVAQFVADTEITMPVLMGSNQTAADWGIKAFPTYFVIDEEGNIDSRSVGYSTSLGLRLRSWLAN